MENLSNCILRRNRHRGAMTGDEIKTLFERAQQYEMESNLNGEKNSMVSKETALLKDKKSQKEKQLNPQKKK